VYPGGTIAPVIDLLDGAGIVTVCTRHEQGAGYAALAAARIFGKPQVVVVSSGPGVTNVVTAVADAYFDAAPLIVFTGQVGTGDMRGDRPVRQRGFQEVDTVALMAPQDADYRAFITQLHARMRQAGSKAALIGGIGPKTHAAGIVLLALVAIAIAGLLVRAIATGEWAGGLFLVGFAALFTWQIGGFVLRNRPQAYTFDHLPEALLP